MAQLFHPGYRHAVDSQNDSSFTAARVLTPEGQRMFKVHSPAMDEGGTTVVFLPYLDENKRPMPERFSTGELDYSHWLVTFRGVRYAGVTKKITMLFAPANDEHPYDAIRRACYSAKNNKITNVLGDSDKDNWYSLVSKPQEAVGTDKSQKGPHLPKATMISLAYCLVYQHRKNYFYGGGKEPRGFRPEDPLTILLMSENQRQALEAQLDKLKDPERPLGPEEFSGFYNYPVVGHKFVNFYNKNEPSTFAMNVARQRASRTGRVGEQSKVEGFGYAVAIADTADGSADLPVRVNSKQVADLAVSKVKDWNQVVYGYEEQEAAEVIGNEMGLPLSLLLEAWKVHKEWYPDTVRFALSPTKSAVMSGPAVEAPSAVQTPEPAAKPWMDAQDDGPADDYAPNDEKYAWYAADPKQMAQAKDSMNAALNDPNLGGGGHYGR